MSGLSRESMVRVLGPVDNALAAALGRIGASEQELREAHAWMQNDESPINELRPLPKGRVGELIELLESFEQPPDEEP